MVIYSSLINHHSSHFSISPFPYHKRPQLNYLFIMVQLRSKTILPGFIVPPKQKAKTTAMLSFTELPGIVGIADAATYQSDQSIDIESQGADNELLENAPTSTDLTAERRGLSQETHTIMERESTLTAPKQKMDVVPCQTQTGSPLLTAERQSLSPELENQEANTLPTDSGTKAGPVFSISVSMGTNRTDSIEDIDPIASSLDHIGASQTTPIVDDSGKLSSGLEHDEMDSNTPTPVSQPHCTTGDATRPGSDRGKSKILLRICAGTNLTQKILLL